ncbi:MULTISPECIES: hypothetical protein [Streptomyces]|uniref:Uncharacterized protein n=2 Tax=Streptomyces rimosus subsp. rimosus TaxID=132474 RepID=L8EDI1_STRR1|nr:MULTISPECIES: hypothetical protein [Streptomyces]KOG67363.1 hypothetical protein ADK78_40920 [Kitasatospora aureofaciens]MYT48397.1 hypothetical protein [Streptomyces sp. SID5471]KOT43714.1 hypothetical protein ADK42_07410 [Streptomyces rimosus subsp. rimosus]KOT44917.1 hypothetical protein ADK84_05945 [Streptomyces sp. NRRL WC-3701]KOT64480.1 hypothetical protein ADK44_09170 [Streptomyces rimosus subsp. rimosus]
MSHPTPYTVRLADEITRQLGQLADHLAQLPPQEAPQALARILDPDNGVFGGVTHLVITGSVFAKAEAERGALPAEVWLALGRASNELNDIALGLDEHRETLQHASAHPATRAAPPVPAPLVVRRRR